MGQVYKINKLPADVREMFHQKIMDSDFYSYEELTEWLKEQGHVVSKSSVHRYVTTFKEGLINNSDEYISSQTYLRLECFKLSVSINSDRSLEQLKMDAEDILNWVTKI